VAGMAGVAGVGCVGCVAGVAGVAGCRRHSTTLLQLVAEHNLSAVVDEGNYSPGCGRMTAS
jgi:hypothetical protein